MAGRARGHAAPAAERTREPRTLASTMCARPDRTSILLLASSILCDGEETDVDPTMLSGSEWTSNVRERTLGALAELRLLGLLPGVLKLCSY